jgi:GMP reductase
MSMTQIRDNIELDFCDVLFRPKRTTLNSRSEADVIREYKFKYYPKTLKSCGIMAANMATTGTFEMNNVLQRHKAITCLHKHIEKSELKRYMVDNFVHNDSESNSFTFVSTGLKDNKEELFSLLKSGSPIDKVCVDVANGYMPKLLEFVKELRNEFPHLLIMVGNVVTGDITQDLIINGADIVKVGIGPGCFHGDMKVKTDNGLKEIKDVSIGDKVLTHTGEYKEVVNKFEFTNHKKYIKINNITSPAQKLKTNSIFRHTTVYPW